MFVKLSMLDLIDNWWLTKGDLAALKVRKCYGCMRKFIFDVVACLPKIARWSLCHLPPEIIMVDNSWANAVLCRRSCMLPTKARTGGSYSMMRGLGARSSTHINRVLDRVVVIMSVSRKSGSKLSCPAATTCRSALDASPCGSYSASRVS